MLNLVPAITEINSLFFKLMMLITFTTHLANVSAIGKRAAGITCACIASAPAHWYDVGVGSRIARLPKEQQSENHFSSSLVYKIFRQRRAANDQRETFMEPDHCALSRRDRAGNILSISLALLAFALSLSFSLFLIHALH